MNPRLIISFFLLLSLQGFGQRASINFIKNNYIYAKYANPVKVLIDDCPCEKVIASIDKGKIEKEDDCKFLVSSDTAGEVFLSVYCETSSKEVEKIRLEVKNFPDPWIYFGGRVNGGSVTKDSLLKYLFIAADFDAPFGVDYEGLRTDIRSFDLIVIRNHKVIYNSQESGTFFKKETQEFFSY